MKIEARESVQILPDVPITVTISGNVIDVMQQARRSRPPAIKWSDDRETYIILATGEVKEKKKRDTRTDDRAAILQLRQTMKRMRQLINANFCGDANELFITLTYRELMTDCKRLKNDMEKFMKKAKRQLGEIKYLYVVEPQERGAWHAHLLVKQMRAHSTYWPADDIASAWGHGFIKVQKIQSVENVGAYLSAYLSNAPADPADDVQREGQQNYGEPGDDMPKAIVKGKRAHLYPKGMHLYRGSKNLEQPIVKKIRPHSKEYERLISDAQLTFARTIDLYDDEQGHDDRSGLAYVNSITQLQFRRNPKGADNDAND